MNVISLDRARARLRPLRPIEPPGALTNPVRPAPQASTSDDEREERARMRQNLAAFLVIVAIVTVGGWLIASLHYYSRLQTCLVAGHRNCLPLEAKDPAQPYWR